MTLHDLESDAIRLEALIQGLEIVHDRASTANDGADLAPEVRDACNAMIPMIEVIRQKAEDLHKGIGTLALAERKGGRA